jgi:rfaE bifunctional protein nucleotidyltransferase chain/domain
MSGTATKIKSLTEALEWRIGRTGPVVFTNGVFDLLHIGHVELLESARGEGAALIVGLNTDGSARRLGKGVDRPLMPQYSRARVIAGLAAVDCVVLFDEDTPFELISRVQPDVLVKGADYSRDRIVGADLVEGRGGRVVRIPLISGVSTSSIVERLRATS